ncbi:MAG: hypothetical protein KIT61_13665 [Pyrinomonadaceae bacterium]|nr:hypothetical protein [Blastocatellia bacterium]MCW5957626.1 hypothetical protein [Pyrinomonadaceae bacterium]
MGDQTKYSLFFVKALQGFAEGILFELENQIVSAASLDPTFGQPFNTIPDRDHEAMGYRLPDRGDGIPGFIAKDDVLPCPPFAENVPPGKCPVKITYQRVLSDADASFDDNPNNIGIFGIYVDENLHWQKIVIPLPENFPQISHVTLTDTLKGFEVDRYETPSLEQVDNGQAYCLHVGHVGPGFYEMDMRLERGRSLRIRFIKFYPPEFESRYEQIKNAVSSAESSVRPTDSMPVNLYHSHAEDNEYEFPAEMMNHALAFATEWGENFRKPIDERMLRIYPNLSAGRIARLKKLADEAESYILRLAEDELAGNISESDIVPMARERYPWVDERQLYRIKNIGMYWARK